MTKKKKIIIAISALIIFIAGGTFFYLRANRNQEEEVETVVKKRVSAKVNIIDVSERPFIQLAPTADGRNVLITILQLKKPAAELTMQA